MRGNEKRNFIKLNRKNSAKRLCKAVGVRRFGGIRMLEEIRKLGGIKKLNGLICLMMCFVLLFSLCACSSTEDTDKPVATEDQEDKIQIGMCFDTFVIERWERDRDIFVSTANELGAEVDVQNPNGDVEEQVSEIEYFIDKGVDVIVVVPIESEALVDVIKKAREKGIKVISYDRLVSGVAVDLYISFDNEAVGTCMGKSMASKLKTGDKVLMLCGPKSDSNVSQVAEGFRTAVEGAGLTVVDETYLDQWKSELAYDYVNDNLDLIKDGVKGIMCGNDNLASQVVFALSENRMAGDILVAGQDADLDACQRIVEGTQYMTVYKPVSLLADQAARTAVDMASGKELVYDELINNGAADIPYIKLSPQAVTIENIDDTIIADGFHQHDEVYINVDK